MSLISNSTINTISTVSNTWHEAALSITNKLNHRISSYMELISKLTDDSVENYQDFVLGDRIVKFADLKTAIVNGHDQVNYYAGQEVCTMAVDTVCQQLGDNANSAKIILAGLETASDEYLSSAADRLSVFQAKIDDITVSRTSEASSSLDFVKAILMTSSMSIKDRMMSLVQLFKPVGNEETTTFTILESDASEYTYGSPIQAAWGLIDIDWSSVGSTIQSCASIAMAAYKKFKQLCVDSFCWGIQKAHEWIRDNITTGTNVTVNPNYERYSSDAGYWDGYVNIHEDYWDTVSAEFTKHEGCACRIVVPGGDLYVTGAEFDSDQNNPSTHIRIKFVPVVPGSVLRLQANNGFIEYNLGIKHLADTYGKYDFDPHLPDREFDSSSYMKTFSHRMFLNSLGRFILGMVTLYYDDDTKTIKEGSGYSENYRVLNDAFSLNLSRVEWWTGITDATISDVQATVNGNLNTGFRNQGSGITTSRMWVKGLQKLLEYIFINKTESDCDIAYEWVSESKPGAFHIETSSDLAKTFKNAAFNIVKVAAAIIATITIAKVTRSLKKKAAVASAQADLYYFSDSFGSTTQEWNTWYAMMKKAQRIELLAGMASDALKSIITSPGKLITQIKNLGAKEQSLSSLATSSEITTLANGIGDNDNSIRNVLKAIKG